MYDELIKRLRASCESCKLWDGYKCCLKGECSAQKSLQAADAIDELSHIQIAPEKIIQTMWIPVTERLPREQETVLIWGKQGVILLDWRHNNKWSCFRDVTHWMPLPKPPESEDNG